MKVHGEGFKSPSPDTCGDLREIDEEDEEEEDDEDDDNNELSSAQINELNLSNLANKSALVRREARKMRSQLNSDGDEDEGEEEEDDDEDDDDEEDEDGEQNYNNETRRHENSLHISNQARVRSTIATIEINQRPLKRRTRKQKSSCATNKNNINKNQTKRQKRPYKRKLDANGQLPARRTLRANLQTSAVIKSEPVDADSSTTTPSSSSLTSTSRTTTTQFNSNTSAQHLQNTQQQQQQQQSHYLPHFSHANYAHAHAQFANRQSISPSSTTTLATNSAIGGIQSARLSEW